MRQTRLVLMAVGGVLLLCVLALIATIVNYTSNPTVAVAHVPPVVGTPSSGSFQSPSAVPTMPVSSDLPSPTDTPQRIRVQLQGPTLAQILQQLDQRRHHRSPGG